MSTLSTVHVPRKRPLSWAATGKQLHCVQLPVALSPGYNSHLLPLA